MKALGGKAHGLRLERMRSSPLWAQDAFRNVHPPLPGLRDPAAKPPTLTEFLCDEGRRVPRNPLPAEDPRDVWARAPGAGLRATWLGHSTVLVEIEGYRVLTDPVWGLRASPSRLLGPKRFQPVPVVTSLGVGAHLEAWGVRPERIVELDWWETHTLPNAELSVTAGPSQHFSGRGLRDRNATLWSSMTIRSPRHTVFFSGDTGLTTQYATIRERLGPFDLVMLEVGGFHPSWGDIHLGPENALEALRLLGGRAFMPVHWGTFALAMHDWDQPAEVLLARGPAIGAPLLMPRLGNPVEPTVPHRLDAWWRAADAGAPRRQPPKPAALTLPKSVPWPLD